MTMVMTNYLAKRWCFTINNPTEEDKFWEKNREQIQYIVIQEERGENGTLHWQGFMILKDKKRMTWLKNHFNERAHWEITRGTNEQARDYCKKEDTYTGGLRVEEGELPKREAPKANERLMMAADELDSIKETYKRPTEIPSLVLLQSGFIPAYKECTSDILGPYRPNLKIITMVGPPATGKSFCIQKYFPTHGRCLCGNSGIWFQNPLANVMVFEEFCGQIQLQRMLQFLDPYPLAVEIKGGMRPALYNLVIITSNTPPNGWYKGDEAGQEGKRTDALLALWDRIGYSGGGYVPARTCGTYLQAPLGLSIQETRDWFNREFRKAIEGVLEEEEGEALS
ncbi:replication-associated protein [Camdisavirus lingis]|uniref:Replication-associated protein n=1 Tax=Macaca fascicularis stool-associated virus TaxID=2663259 RepID=A0A5P9VJP3_9VIRU|nr:replication-associated protein [Macaca fascicularis stool-associated virus]